MTAYYNENDPNAAEWLRQLIQMGQIAPGDVDERSVVDVPSVELRPYEQLHFFAGIGVWSYALRQAGWPDERPVVTGSCPCQPFSQAGKRKGAGDERDLWWAMFWHLCQLQPTTVFGEQVASKDGLKWWDIVSSDLEGQNYTTAAFDLCAAGVGAPHIRQRLFWVANANSPGFKWENASQPKRWIDQAELVGTSSTVSLANPEYAKWRKNGKKHVSHWQDARRDKASSGTRSHRKNGVLANTKSAESQRDRAESGRVQSGPAGTGRRGFWSNCDWLQCSDGKARSIKSGLSPLVDGTPPDLVQGRNTGVQTEETKEARIMRLKGYGNAIVAPLATEFIKVCMEVAA